MGDELPLLLDRIRLLLENGSSNGGAPSDEVERTLTDGYARALVLEAERQRAELRIRALAGSADGLGEIRALKRTLAQVDEQIAQLRTLLRGLAATL